MFALQNYFLNSKFIAFFFFFPVASVDVSKWEKENFWSCSWIRLDANLPGPYQIKLIVFNLLPIIWLLVYDRNEGIEWIDLLYLRNKTIGFGVCRWNYDTDFGAWSHRWENTAHAVIKFSKETF